MGLAYLGLQIIGPLEKKKKTDQFEHVVMQALTVSQSHDICEHDSE